ncbi:MAG: stage III sporulation protein AF [Bacillota bacterium]
MIEAIGNLIRYIVILIFLATLLEMILPHGQFRRYLRMLVGILLILTILSPIQNIMRLAPGWDVPVFLAAPTGKEELALILQRGEKMREEGLKEAVGNYRYRLYQVVESLLAREYGGELLELEVILDEDPGSAEFGAIKKMVVVIREKKSTSPSSTGSPVEEISISVTRGEKTDMPLKKTGETEAAFSPATDQEVAVAKFLARYFLLAEERVNVSIIP